MRRVRGRLLAYLLVLFLLAPCGLSFCGEEYAGELFDVKVPVGNYYFVRSALIVFGKEGRRVQDNPEELEAAIWDELLMSYEAFRRGIDVTQKEVEQELTDMLANSGVNFNWRQDPEAFKKWVSEKTGEPVQLFANQVQHILQIRKLRSQVMQTIEPKVNDKEALEVFLNENTALSMELVEFPDERPAWDFYRKAKSDPKFWENEKEKRAKDFRQFGPLSVAFFIDLWKIPRDACFNMAKMRGGEFYGPSPIYKGYAVFKVLASRSADKAKYAKAKDAYYEKVKVIKKYAGVNEWFNNLKKQAKIKVYPAVKESPPKNS